MGWRHACFNSGGSPRWTGCMMMLRYPVHSIPVHRHAPAAEAFRIFSLIQSTASTIHFLYSKAYFHNCAIVMFVDGRY
jgi:hypothetical protein